ncbi:MULTISPECIES: hypothetical protein [Nostocales]|nr:hypothetical protein [Tolypothrix bouteillei]KAF3886036.1 hypothetical protein DA73_0400011560 [Tolypothrix bouteillei VB521301]
MKPQYLIAPLITVGIISIFANYGQGYNFLHLVNNPARIVKILKNEHLEARIPPNRGIPTGRESGSSRQLKWENQ